MRPQPISRLLACAPVCRARASLLSSFPVTFPPCPWSISPEVTAGRLVQLQLEAAAAGFAEPPGRRSERGESLRSGRAPTSRCGARSRPARARPPPSSLLPPPPPHLPLLPLCLGCSAARLALGEPQRQRRVSLLETEPGCGDTEQPPRELQGARRTSPPSASAAHC